MYKWIFLCFDLIVVALSPFIALAVRNNFQLSWWIIERHLVYAEFSVSIASIIFIITGTHKGIWRYTSLHDFMRILAAVTMIILFTMFAMFALDRLDNISRSIPLIQWGIIIASMSCLRLVTRLIHKRGQSRKISLTRQKKEQILVVGLNDVAELYLRCIEDLASGAFSIVGILDESDKLKGRLIHHHRVLGSPVDLPIILAQLNVHGVEVHRVVITMPFRDLSQDSQDMLLKYERSGPLILDMFEERLGLRPDSGEKSPLSDNEDTNFAEMSSTMAERQIPSRKSGYAFVKRTLDIIGALLLLAFALPLMPLVSLLVAIDVGLPLTFWQQRPGLNGRPFKLFKYRTMSAGHDADGNSIPNEERLSFFGRFLRRIRLDELPQLYNILVGEMSFVGPRPLLPKDQPQEYILRLSMRPGLTGWSQINGGKLVSMEDKMLMDCWYVNHASFRLDMRIIFGTIKTVIWGERLNVDAIRLAYEDQGRTWPGEKQLALIKEKELGNPFLCRPAENGLKQWFS